MLLAIALVVDAAMFFLVPDALGANLATFVQAASSVVLAVVTVSYVIATSDLAKTAAEQFNFIAREPERAAVLRVWSAFVDTRVDAVTSIQRTRQQAISAPQDANDWIFTRQRDAQIRTNMRWFHTVVSKDQLELPEAVRGPALAVADDFLDAAAVMDALDECISRQVRWSIDKQLSPTRSRLRRDWNVRGRLQTPSAPTWVQLMDGERERAVLVHVRALEAAVTTFNRR